MTDLYCLIPYTLLCQCSLVGFRCTVKAPHATTNQISKLMPIICVTMHLALNFNPVESVPNLLVHFGRLEHHHSDTETMRCLTSLYLVPKTEKTLLLLRLLLPCLLTKWISASRLPAAFFISHRPGWAGLSNIYPFTNFTGAYNLLSVSTPRYNID